VVISLVPDAPWAASVFGYARPGETQSTAIAHYWCPSERALIRRLDEECSDSSYHVALATSRERGQRATLHRSTDGWYVASRRPWAPQGDV
jgi:hypothetical protein